VPLIIIANAAALFYQQPRVRDCEVLLDSQAVVVHLRQSQRGTKTALQRFVLDLVAVCDEVADRNHVSCCR